MARWQIVIAFIFTLGFSVLMFIVTGIGAIFDRYELAYTYCDARSNDCSVIFLAVEHGVMLSSPLDDPPLELDWSPEGGRILITQNTSEGVRGYVLNIDDGSRSPFNLQIFRTAWLSEDRLMMQVGATSYQVYDFANETFDSGVFTSALSYPIIYFSRLSPDGQYLAVSSDRGIERPIDILIIRMNTNDPALPIPNVFNVRFTEWSPDSQEIIYTSMSGGDYDIYVTTISTGETRQLTSGRDIEYLGHWSHDGRRVAFISRDRGGAPYHLNILNSDDGSIHSIDINANFSEQIYFVETLEWSPDDHYLVIQLLVGAGNGSLYLVTTDGTDSVHRITDTGIYDFLTWRP